MEEKNKQNIEPENGAAMGHGAASCSVAVSTKRPLVDAEIIKIAATKTAENTANINPCDVGLLAKDIAKYYSRLMNGYDLAKNLDGAGWDVDPVFVDDMDMMDSYVREAHQKKCYEWVKNENIKPTLMQGTHISTNGISVLQGVIGGICQHLPAAYLVKEDGCTSSGRFLIVNFEDTIVTP